MIDAGLHSSHKLKHLFQMVLFRMVSILFYWRMDAGEMLATVY